jgi:riboflavin synthase
MFTGIISDVGIVRKVESPQVNMRRFSIETAYDVDTINIGASISHDGCCLTVVTKYDNQYEVEVSEHTLNHTTLGNWKVGSRINLERALKAGDELGGHIVSGHVDGVATIASIQIDGECSNYSITPPTELLPYIATKGSVTLDGTSLTVTWVESAEFGLTLIPHTLQATTWGQKCASDKLNIEIDVLARYMRRIMECK